MSKSVLIVDRHPLVQDLIARLLTEGGFTVVSKTGSGADALRAVVEKPPDVALVDLQIGDVDGVTCIRRLREASPSTTVVALSESSRDEDIAAALSAGAAAYALKSMDPHDIVTAVRQALRQSVFFSAVEAQTKLGGDDGPHRDLTRREVEILKLVSEGASNREVAQTLWITEQTVKFHLSNIYRKLSVSNRTEAARYARVHGLFAQSQAERTKQGSSAVTGGTP